MTKKKNHLEEMIKSDGDQVAFLIPTETVKGCEKFKEFTKFQVLLHEKYAQEVKQIANMFNIKIDVKTILKS